MQRRSGFTLVERAVVSFLFVLLAMVLAQTWAGLGRPTVDLIVRSRLAREARLAANALSRDLGGSLANPEGRLGTQGLYRIAGRLQPDGVELWLCFDGGSAPNGAADWAAPDTVIVYHVQDRQLIRWDQAAGTAFVVARDVDSLSVQNQGDTVRISLTLSHRNLTRTFTLVAYRNMVSALRLETVHVQQTQRDEGSIHALARAVTLMETGLPPSSPYVRGAIISTSTGPRSYTVTFVLTGGTNWRIDVTPTEAGEEPALLPVTFAP